MKSILVLLLCLFVTAPALKAQPSTPEALGKADTTWPGIQFRLLQIQRIAGNRLLLVIKVYATPQAPPTGTMIGVIPPTPKNADPCLVGGGVYRPRPFSLESATMTDEITKQPYTTLSPSPSGPNYIGGQVLTSLHVNEGALMTIQFPVPPPPAPVDGIIPKQTVSILLPNAVGPIKHITIPPPPSSPSSPAGH